MYLLSWHFVSIFSICFFLVLKICEKYGVLNYKNYSPQCLAQNKNPVLNLYSKLCRYNYTTSIFAHTCYLNRVSSYSGFIAKYLLANEYLFLAQLAGWLYNLSLFVRNQDPHKELNIIALEYIVFFLILQVYLLFKSERIFSGEEPVFIRLSPLLFALSFVGVLIEYLFKLAFIDRLKQISRNKKSS